jgi:hypothetical protein
MCVSSSAIAKASIMAPSTFIPDFDESSSSSTSLNDKAASASRLSPNSKRSITISPFETIYNALHINDYSDEEIASAWYNADELETIKKTDVINTLSMMKGGVKIPEANPFYSSRGLESLTREGFTKRKANRENAWNAVLDEQDLQWDEDICDPQAIANAYSQLSRACQDAAVMKAIQDQDTSHAASFKLKGGGASISFGSVRISHRRMGGGFRREISSKAA